MALLNRGPSSPVPSSHPRHIPQQQSPPAQQEGPVQEQDTPPQPQRPLRVQSSPTPFLRRRPSPARLEPLTLDLNHPSLKSLESPYPVSSLITVAPPRPSTSPFPFPGPSPPSDEEEEATWLVILVLSTVLIITLASVIRSCGQKAGWLTGDDNSEGGGHGHNASSSSGSSGGGRGGSVGGARRGGYSGSGPHRVTQDNLSDPDETEERLAALTDAERQAYDAAKAFQIANPPCSVPTDISLSQYLSIQEKGVAAWEFEASFDTQLFVHERTELSFYDRVASVQTNLPLPKQQEVYYWEVKVFEKSPNTAVAVGVSTKPFPTTRLPGWNRHSVGYHSKDGRKYYNSPWSGYPYGPIYFEGDVIGCGYRPRHGTIFFTRNGKRLEEAYTGFKTNLFPTVGATGPCVLHVNFGQSGFVFVEANVKKWGLAPASGSLAPPPAYGSEMGSILLEAGGSSSRVVNGGAPGGRLTPGSSSSSSRRPVLQTSRSRARLQAAGALQTDSRQHPQQSHTYESFGAGVGDGQGSMPVQISLSNMSAPPPNYSSLDRHGHVIGMVGQGVVGNGGSRTVPSAQEVFQRHDEEDEVEEEDEELRSQASRSRTSRSRSSSDSDESIVALLGDAQPGPLMRD